MIKMCRVSDAEIKDCGNFGEYKFIIMQKLEKAGFLMWKGWTVDEDICSLDTIYCQEITDLDWYMELMN